MQSQQKVLKEEETWGHSNGKESKREGGEEEKKGPFPPCPHLSAPWLSTNTPIALGSAPDSEASPESSLSRPESCPCPQRKQGQEVRPAEAPHTALDTLMSQEDVSEPRWWE